MIYVWCSSLFCFLMWLYFVEVVFNFVSPRVVTGSRMGILCNLFLVFMSCAHFYCTFLLLFCQEIVLLLPRQYSLRIFFFGGNSSKNTDWIWRMTVRILIYCDAFTFAIKRLFITGKQALSNPEAIFITYFPWQLHMSAWALWTLYIISITFLLFSR